MLPTAAEMGDLPTKIATGQVGVAGLLLLFAALFLLAIGVGLLVPRRTVKDMRTDFEARLQEQIAQATLWQTAYQKMLTANSEKDRQMVEMLTLARTSTHVLTSLPRPPEEQAHDPAAQLAGGTT